MTYHGTRCGEDPAESEATEQAPAEARAESKLESPPNCRVAESFHAKIIAQPLPLCACLDVRGRYQRRIHQRVLS